MNLKSRQTLILLILALCFLAESSWILSSDASGLPPEEFAKRRAAVLQQLPDSAVAIFHAALPKTRSNDVTYEYRQNNNFYYLTGITDASCALVLVSGGIEINGKETAQILFVPKRRARVAAYEDEAISIDLAENELGFTAVYTYDTFGNQIEQILTGRSLLFYSFPIEFLYEPVGGKRYFIAQQTKKALQENFSGLKVKSPNKILASLRQIKSPAEMALLQKSIDLTEAAQIEVIRAAKTGMYEYELEAMVEYIFKRGGAEYPAFPSIVGSGPNSTILHHWTNRRKIEDGDLVVIDIGAEYRGYSADITRTIPINGKFSKEQREIYEIVLRAQKEAMAAVKPGVPFRDVHKVAKKVIKEAGYAKYFNHGTSHYLGLDTHDVGGRGPLLPGMVITVEPGIYIPEGAELDKAYWNIGVRIEDDVLVTETGYRHLSDKSPREIADIEKLMQEGAKLTFHLD